MEAKGFFDTLINLTCTSYFTTEAGFNYIGYKGSISNLWDGVPDKLLKKHRFEYPVKYKDIYLKPEERGTVAQWDEKRKFD